MKFRIKSIAFFILLMLVLVCGYQAYWLVSFHNEQYDKMEAAIMTALGNADFKEIAMRITTIHELQKDDSIPIQNQNKVLHYPGVIMPDVVVRIESTREDGVKIWDDAKSMNVSVQQGFHRTVDTLKAIDFLRFDSLLHAELSSLEINIPYYLECVNIETDSVLMRLPEDISQNERVKYEEFVFPFSEDKKQAYHLYLKQPRWHIFKSMLGLVAISVLMVALLIISYVYLLRIILRQKTIDEIKGDFINNMTHELKTPISVTYAAIDGLQNFGIGDDSEKRDKYLSISKDQLMYLNSLVEQILNMSVEERKNLKLNPVDIHLAEIFEDQRNKFLLNAPKPIEIEIEITPPDLEIRGDKIHFMNIMSNLIENAVKYSGDSVFIKLSAYKEGGKKIVSVSDNGIGIPNGVQDRIFDKFYRVSTGNIHNVKGYGLGLSYVKTIVEKHGWKIQVDSKEGRGSHFIIEVV
ncbi:sensor histidine kinase KdpD [Dysgonomonas sp. 511]|uniref:sensor histidine kinase n=1 Tax=Dysgonomonas sp. 511 TaxID=2302930 RepID=UPI0013D71CF6|nr:HAMP domain-containing sensor histidine kinase [Dysgonomonas sp. 511]NDV77754.1 sensor histidine kinase [Dysgonomonas sp. 511]